MQLNKEVIKLNSETFERAKNQTSISVLSTAVTQTVTWKFVSFQPGFFASILTKAWQGITALSMVSTAWKQKLVSWLTFQHIIV